MTDKKKITLIYVAVALICGLSIFGFTTLGKLYDIKAEAEKPVAVDIGKDTETEYLKLTKSITLTNQDGEAFSITDLKDKVWVFAQFFAKCPMCAERNYTDLSNLYKKYKDDPRFMIVCMTVDPETDDVERLKEYADIVNADSKSWVFLTGDKEKLHSYMADEMKFMDIRERTDPQEIAAKGKYAHDLGLAVFDKGLTMRLKRDLSFARSQNEDLTKTFESELHNTIENCLNNND